MLPRCCPSSVEKIPPCCWAWGLFPCCPWHTAVAHWRRRHRRWVVPATSPSFPTPLPTVEIRPRSTARFATPPPRPLRPPQWPGSSKRRVIPRLPTKALRWRIWIPNWAPAFPSAPPLISVPSLWAAARLEWSRLAVIPAREPWVLARR